MAGTFSKSVRPKRPGAYFNFVAREAEPVLENTLGVLAVPFTHTWGPNETVVELSSFGDFLAVFGQGGTTPPAYTEGYKAVLQAFLGEGLPGRGGAGKVLAYRMTGTSALRASRILQNATPAAAITLTARYEGTYGNRLKATVQADATSPATQDNLLILDNNVEVERFVYAKTNITDLVAQINGTAPYSALTSSDWITATQTVTGVALGVVANQAFTAGHDGAAPAASDYTAFMAAIEPFRFSLLSPANLTDGPILASLVTWAKNLNNAGKRFMTIVGGGTTGVPDTMTLAIARSGTINDPNFVNVGAGVYTDERLGALTPAELAPRVAGILALRGERESLTFARMAGLAITTGPTEGEILAGLAGGVVTFSRDSHPQAPVRIEKGLTTFTTLTDADRPFRIYSVPKFVRTMHNLETELTEFAEVNVIGRLPVNDATRAFLTGQMQARFAGREANGVIQSGWSVKVDGDPPPSDNDDFIALLYGVKFGRSLEQVFNTVVIG